MSYETFLLGQYNIECCGLFYDNGVYLIHCPTVTANTQSLEGENLHHWFDMRKIIGTNIKIVNALPENAIKVDTDVDKAKSPGTGYLVTNSDIVYEINLLIPGIFPDYEIQLGNPITIVFKEEVTQEGIHELEAIFQMNVFPIKCSFINDPAAITKTEAPAGGFFSYIIPSRYAKHKMGKQLADKWEEDEDEWIINRGQILSGKMEGIDRENYFNAKKFRCVIDCRAGTPFNIRSYLSLYEEVCIVLPLKNIESVLKGLDISREELIELVSLNKLQILAPSSIELYDLPLMESLVYTNSRNVHLARRLTSLILQENSRRNPLYLPFLPLEERKILLQSCDQASQVLSDTERKKIQKLLSSLGNSWVRMPNAINQLPSGFLSAYGIPDMLDTIFFEDAPAHQNLSIDTKLAAPSVELTAALGATFVPVLNELTPIYRMIADLYSGIPNENWIIQKPDYANFAVEDLLVISDKIPVIEFAQTFTGAEINRFRETILAISQNAKDLEDLETNISAFNHFVKSYEKDKNKLNLMNLSGFVLKQSGKTEGIPFASWLIKILQKYVLKQARKSTKLGAILDQMEANVVGNFPNAVLVSTMKTKLKDRI
ncbi:MAG: hypothetical protein ACJ748_01975 [Flavisolibacter sp.]